jgi:serine protease Do
MEPNRSKRPLLYAAVIVVAAAAAPMALAVSGDPKGPGVPAPSQGAPASGEALRQAMDIPRLVEQVGPAVVNITTTQQVKVPEAMLDPFEFFFGPHDGHHGPEGAPFRERTMHRTSLGTGFIIDPNGYVVTNEHVVEGADKVSVRLLDDRELKADVVGRDPRLDVALLKLEGAKDLPTVTLGSSSEMRVGDPVIAIGNPFGLGNTVTHGIVSAKARSIGAGPYDDFIQTDASINPGNSGGPLFDSRGEVIGINTAIRAGATGIGFAIPIDDVKEVLPQLREKGKVARGMLGVSVQSLTPELAQALHLDRPEGALVAQVEPGSAGARAGLRPGDLIVSVEGQPIRHADELPRLVARHAPGAKLAFSVLRDGKTENLTATLEPLRDENERAERGLKGGPNASPKGEAAAKLGVRVSNVPGGTGVRVEDVVDEDAAGDLRPGDVIVEMNGAKIGNTTDLRVAQAKAKPGSTALLKVKRGEASLFVAVPVGAK